MNQKSKAGYGEATRFFRDVVLTYDGDECLTWPFATSKRGYGKMNVAGYSSIVSNRVCEIIYGPRPTPGHVSAHSCGRGHEACCTKRHLSWKTQTDNKADELVHGTRNFGEKNGAAKLSAGDVEEIRSLAGKLTHREIAKRFSVSESLISRIHAGKNWKYVGTAS